MNSSEKVNISITDFYQSLERLEKGKFVLYVQNITTYSHSTVMARLKDDGWRPLERSAITKAIQEQSWR